MFKLKISRKENLLTILKYPLRFFLSKLSAIHEKKYSQIAHYSSDYIGQCIDVDGFYEIRELELIDSWLSETNPKVFRGLCLDIGANIGNHSLFFARKFQKVFAFEVLPKNIALLKINCEEKNNISIFEFGLSDENKKIDFYFNPSNLGGTSSYYRDNLDLEKLNLEVKKLDDLSFDKSAVTFIKLDVEGSELDIIRGAKKLLKDLHPVICFEQYPNDFKDNSFPIINELRELGYNKFFITKTSPIFVEQDNFFGLLITFITSMIFGGKKLIIEKSKFMPKYYPLIFAIKK